MTLSRLSSDWLIDRTMQTYLWQQQKCKNFALKALKIFMTLSAKSEFKSDKQEVAEERLSNISVEIVQETYVTEQLLNDFFRCYVSFVFFLW